MAVADRISYLVAKRTSNGRLGIFERHKVSTPHLKADEQRAQATMMMMRRLFGESTITELGEEFGVDPRTVNRRLALARTDGVPDAARKVFIDEMLPASMAVLHEALKGGDMKLAVQVAIKVVEGLKAMEHPATANPVEPAAPSTGPMDETLEVWRARIIRRAPSADDPSPTGPIHAADVIDATLAPTAEAGASTASATGPAPLRLPPHDPAPERHPAAAAPDATTAGGIGVAGSVASGGSGDAPDGDVAPGPASDSIDEVAP